MGRQKQRIRKLQASIYEYERHDLLRVGVGALAHDTNNMLAIIQGLAYALADPRAEDTASSSEVMERIEETTQRISHLLRKIQRIQTSDDTILEDVNLGDMGRSLSTLASHHPRVMRRNVTTEGCDPRRAPSARIHRRAFESALVNLLINAGDATGLHGKIKLCMRSARDEGVYVEVHDDGFGIPEDRWEELVQPFATTKPNGSGLGLASAKECAERHGGRLELAKSELGGACVRLYLPPRVVVGNHQNVA